jgi:hypothetical protein
MAGFWSGKRALVTGSAGFQDTFEVSAFSPRGCLAAFVARSGEYDLRREAETPLEQGLRHTIAWCRRRRAEASPAGESYPVLQAPA